MIPAAASALATASPTPSSAAGAAASIPTARFSKLATSTSRPTPPGALTSPPPTAAPRSTSWHATAKTEPASSSARSSSLSPPQTSLVCFTISRPRLAPATGPATSSSPSALNTPLAWPHPPPFQRDRRLPAVNPLARRHGKRPALTGSPLVSPATAWIGRGRQMGEATSQQCPAATCGAR